MCASISLAFLKSKLNDMDQGWSQWPWNVPVLDDMNTAQLKMLQHPQIETKLLNVFQAPREHRSVYTSISSEVLQRETDTLTDTNRKRQTEVVNPKRLAAGQRDSFVS